MSLLANNTLLINLRSGQWRIGNVSLMVINCEGQSPENGEQWYTGYQYEFLVDNVLLGEGSKLSMLELRHSHMSELQRIDPINFVNKGLDDSTLFSSPKISNEESMREYADLKFSLLFYDVMLIFFGTSVASFSAGENVGFALLVGGIQGFLYLLLLQRSVDALSASELITGSKGEALFGRLKGPIASVALVVGFAVFTAMYSSVDLQVTPRDLIVGMMGFLACKVYVVLATFKPIKLGLKLPSDM
ncbi:hypothetical protein TanjilG_31354 [Lupinus angustifolius]|uniref:DUF7755 domain-containing protein n=2 Tax=Lupinus angustifolius TaxID=3871 RepID=A0A1J7HZ04_LUPAN|nr:hypothetical protein TanjilG_31354 [Lupinus angustifolius]